MTTVRKMRADEFDAYIGWFIPDYASEISSNYDVDPEEARARAERTVAEELAHGVDTPGQVLLCIVPADDRDGAALGYFWCIPNAATGVVFISDFFILPEQRGKGHGRAALKALEAWLVAEGFAELRLRVAADNARAERLYRTAGFRVTGINMQKALAQG